MQDVCRAALLSLIARGVERKSTGNQILDNKLFFCFYKSRCFFKDKFSPVVLMTLLLFAGASGVFADDDEPQAGLVIESTTEECSADYHIAREKGENPDEAEDKKRDVVDWERELD